MVVTRISPTTNPSSDRFRKRGIYSTGPGDHSSGRDGRFNGRRRSRRCNVRGGRGRGGHGQRGHGGISGEYENGIDISYFTCYFEDAEWSSLSKKTRKRIAEDPVHTKFLAHKKRRTTSSVSNKKYHDNRLISQIINGVQNNIRYESGLEG